MATLTFAPYNLNTPLFQQTSNIAFMMLQGAVMNTQERPEEPKRAKTWVNMNKIMTEIAALEHEHSEVVNTPDGPRSLQIIVLKPEGGSFELDKECFDLLRRIWETHRDTKLMLSQARQVAITEQFLKNCDTIVSTDLD